MSRRDRERLDAIERSVGALARRVAQLVEWQRGIERERAVPALGLRLPPGFAVDRDAADVIAEIGRLQEDAVRRLTADLQLGPLVADDVTSAPSLAPREHADADEEGNEHGS